MPPKKDAKKGDKGEKKDEGKWSVRQILITHSGKWEKINLNFFLVKTVEKTEKETLLEAELKKVEDEYKATRQKVNDLRHMSDKEL